jgi:hypothetical protein
MKAVSKMITDFSTLIAIKNIPIAAAIMMA